MDKFLTNKKTKFILYFIAFGLLTLIMILGFFEIESGKSCDSYYNYCYYYSRNLYTLGWHYGFFVLITFGLMFAFAPVAILEFIGKINYRRSTGIISIIFYTSVSSLLFCFSFFELWDASYSTLLVVAIIVLSFIINSVILVLLFINIYQLAKMPKYYTKKQKEQIRKQQSVDAVQKLKQLKELLDLGAITQEEFEEKKKNYIDYL